MLIIGKLNKNNETTLKKINDNLIGFLLLIITKNIAIKIALLLWKKIIRDNIFIFSKNGLFNKKAITRKKNKVKEPQFGLPNVNESLGIKSPEFPHRVIQLRKLFK